MTPKERAAMQQALKALKREGAVIRQLSDEFGEQNEIAITALREALAELDIEEMTLTQIAARHEQAEQEPVAQVTVKHWGELKIAHWVYSKLNEGIHNLYAAPVRTKDLTYAELGELFVKAKEETFGYARVKPEGGISLKPSIEYFARAVIAKFKEKNK